MKTQPNEKFGRWTVICFSHKDSSSNDYYLCKCSCINKTQRVVRGSALRHGYSLSCGCLTLENSLKVKFIHGQASTNNRTRTYRSWEAMIRRCTSPTAVDYRNYGGRGITVCDRWVNSFENFYTDMGERPKGLTLDRTDNDGNYEPSNCTWKTPKEQANNRRNNKK